MKAQYRGRYRYVNFCFKRGCKGTFLRSAQPDGCVACDEPERNREDLAPWPPKRDIDQVTGCSGCKGWFVTTYPRKGWRCNECQTRYEQKGY